MTYATDHKPLYEDTDSMKMQDDTDRLRISEEVDIIYDTIRKLKALEDYPDPEKTDRVQVSEWPVLCRDGSTKILVVMSDRYTGEILHMFRKEDDIKEHPSSVCGSTKETREMLRKAELNARYGKAATDGKEAD